MNISFQHPWVLLILPVIIAALIVSMKFMYSRNMAQKVSRIFVRFIVAALLVLALSGITFKIVGKDVTTIFLVDVSDSVKERKDEVTTYISDAIKTKGRHDYVGVIAFGGDSRVEQFISKDVTFSGLMTEVNTQATNLEDAGNREDLGFIEENAGRFLSDYEAYKDKLSRLKEDEDDSDKEMIPEDELLGAYSALRDVIPQMDYDAVEMILEQLHEYALPKEDDIKIKELYMKRK